MHTDPVGDPEYPCRIIPTKRCPDLYEDVYGPRPCARYESHNEAVWLAELSTGEVCRHRLQSGQPDRSPGDPMPKHARPTNTKPHRRARLAAGALVGAVVVTGVTWTAVAQSTSPQHARVGIPSASAGTSTALLPSVPAAMLNPDVTQATIAGTVCLAGWTKTVRPPSSYTTALKTRQMAAQGLPGTTADYEEDHLIPLELGGAPRAEANLWPEPWPEARRKDAEENRLHAAVCAGSMTLDQARLTMYRNWAGK